MSKSENRGKTFEERVQQLLTSLQASHSELVRLTCQPRLRLQNGDEVIPDFEVRYDLGFQQDARLIECQSRNRSSSAIVHKMRHIKSLSSRNRFIFVYEDEHYLSESTRNSLTSDGVSFYSFDEFETFIRRLDLALRGIQAASFVAEHSPPGAESKSAGLAALFLKFANGFRGRRGKSADELAKMGISDLSSMDGQLRGFHGLGDHEAKCE